MPFGGGGNPCVICEKTAYPAETITFEKVIYHFGCFKCTTCDKKMDGPAKAKAFEGTLYCVHCFTKGGFAQKQRNVKWVKKEGTSSGTSKFGGGGNPCFLCAKTVFPAEAQSFDKKIYHMACMACTYEKTEGEVCGKKLTAATSSSYEDKLYCKQCFSAGGYAQKQRNVKWTKKEGGSSAVASKFGGGGTKCTTCDKTVYQAETVMFEKKPYHSQCFKCKNCTKQCTPSGAAQFEDAVYCTKCFKDLGLRQKQASTGKKAGGSSGTVDAKFSKFGGGGNKCKKCEKTVYPAETVSYEKKCFHQACFVCEREECAKKLTPATAEYHKPTDSIHCKACFQSLNYHRAANS